MFRSAALGDDFRIFGATGSWRGPHSLLWPRRLHLRSQQASSFSGQRPSAREHERWRQIAPDDPPLHGAEVPVQELHEIELPHLPVLQLQTMEILILGEDAGFAEKTPELTQEGAPLPGGHKTQGQRGDYRVDTFVPATVYLLLEHLF